jgi:hypothetical protein
MSKKKDQSGNHMAFTLGTTGGIIVLRKVLRTAWKKAVGKEPPTDVTDPKVTLIEALAWTVAMAIIAETTRFWIAVATGHRKAAAIEAPEGDTESD